MQINEKLINYLEDLSYLALEKEEKNRLSTDLQNILKNMQELSELNTQGIPELNHPFEYTNNFRADEVQKSYERSLILQNAKTKTEEMFVAPKTVSS